jgi:zinc transporter 1/2/3
MFLTERLSLDAMAAAEEANCEAVSGDGNAADVEAPKARQAGEESEEDAHSHEHLSALSAARSIAGQHAGHAHGGHSHAHDYSPGAVAPLAPGRGHAHAHGALALSVEAASGGATTGVAAAAARRRIMTARLLEISIVVHSFIIGLNLGTTLAETGHEAHEEEEEHHRRLLRRLLSMHEVSHAEDDMMSSEPSDSLRQTVALIIVLVFHQLFEGVALGSYIYELRDAASLQTKLLMAAVFALTVPVGCWIGIGVASTYEAHTQTAIWVTGALNGVTGGMLLYSALITFMAEEFSRDDLGGAQGRTHKRRMYCCMLLGAAAMALLAIWA